MLLDRLFNQGYSLGHPDVRPAYQAGVGDVVQVDKLSKVFIYRNKDSVF